MKTECAQQLTFWNIGRQEVPELATTQVGTVRQRLLKVGVRVTASARRLAAASVRGTRRLLCNGKVIKNPCQGARA